MGQGLVRVRRVSGTGPGQRREGQSLVREGEVCTKGRGQGRTVL